MNLSFDMAVYTNIMMGARGGTSLWPIMADAMNPGKKLKNPC
jgi:hypothetical protein